LSTASQIGYYEYGGHGYNGAQRFPGDEYYPFYYVNLIPDSWYKIGVWAKDVGGYGGRIELGFMWLGCRDLRSVVCADIYIDPPEPDRFYFDVTDEWAYYEAWAQPPGAAAGLVPMWINPDPGTEIGIDNASFSIDAEPVIQISTYYVDVANGSDSYDGTSWATAFATIQKGIDSAIDGNTVIVADGTYTGNGNRDLDFGGKKITLKSANGPENCIISPNGGMTEQHRGFYFHNSEDVNSIVEGFTITKGYATNGAGVFCLNNSNPLIRNCVLNDNTAVSSGGGVYCSNNSAPVIKNCVLNDNTALNRGGGMYNESSNPIVTGCTFTNNWAGGGGGMYNGTGSPIVINCKFHKNNGGGMNNEQNSNPTVTNCIFSENWSFYYNDVPGSGMANFESSPTVVNCTFSDNWVGGMFNGWGSNTTVTDCTFRSNKGGGMLNDTSSPTLTNCLFISNTEGGMNNI
jgi:parallel beta-helix repeat protein